MTELTSKTQLGGNVGDTYKGLRIVKIYSDGEYSWVEDTGENWNHYAVNWVPATITTAITGGEVREYTSSDPSSPVYRFEPNPYVHSSDAFYNDFDGTSLSNLLAARG